MKFEFADQLVLHTFVDASFKAYGAIMHICTNTSSSFVMTKDHVSPLKNPTLTRLELMTTLVGARLCSFVISSLSHLHFQHVVIWSVKLLYIGYPVRKNYQCLFRIVYRRYIDCYLKLSGNLVTRDILFSSLNSSDLWRQGPD